MASFSEAERSVGERVVVGVDPSPESLAAVRQAGRLVLPSGALHLVGVVEVDLAVHGGYSAATILDELERDEREALERALQSAGESAITHLVSGDPVRALRAEIDRIGATLVAVGPRGHRRATGILLGGVVATMLHEAPCSVLVAREEPEPPAFPRSIVVGVDGSDESLGAAEVASGLAERFGAELRRLVATGGKAVDVDAIETAIDESDPRSPVDALVAASEGVDLLVVGSRGLHGLRALGSVSERVAHRARCSVLVVRRA